MKKLLCIVCALLILGAACAKNDDGGGQVQIIKIELYPDKAPETVANFVSLIEEGFYDGLTFHRIDPNFMIQGGDPLGNGTGGPGHMIVGEFAGNGFVQNDLPHTRGVISMARSGHPDSAGSQFFICVGPPEKIRHLDGNYAAFGKVTEGLDVVDEIANGPASGDRALKPRKMQKVTVETIDGRPVVTVHMAAA